MIHGCDGGVVAPQQLLSPFSSAVRTGENLPGVVDEQLQYEYKSGGQLYLRESDGTPFEDDFEKYSMKVVKLTESTLVIEEYFKEDSDNEIRANYTFKRIS